MIKKFFYVDLKMELIDYSTQGDVTNQNSTKLTEEPNASVRPLAAPGVCGV